MALPAELVPTVRSAAASVVPAPAASATTAVAVHLAFAAALFVLALLAARFVHRLTVSTALTAERLRTVRQVGYAVAVLGTILLARALGTAALLASAIARAAPGLPPALAWVAALAGLLVGPVLLSALGVVLATVRYRALARRLDLTYRDVAGWFATRYAAGVLALTAATAIVTLLSATLARVAATVLLGAVGAAAAPYAIAFTVRDRPATAAERERAQVPEDVLLRIADDRTRVGVAAAAGLVPGGRYVFVTEAAFALLSDRQLAGVVAHEVGHHRCGHVLLRYGTVVALAVPPLVALDFGGTTAVLASAVLSLAGLLVAFAVVRHTEYAADDYAARSVGGAALAEALERLAAERLLLTTPGPHAGPLAAHPPLRRRIDRLRGSERLARGEAAAT
ncbi:MAG: M48 family metallopeptidase [Haloarculaceae archaeon]